MSTGVYWTAGRELPQGHDARLQLDHISGLTSRNAIKCGQIWARFLVC